MKIEYNNLYTHFIFSTLHRIPIIEEKHREVPAFKEEDIILVMQQANVTREKAIQALTESKGDMAQAILSLAT